MFFPCSHDREEWGRPAVLKEASVPLVNSLTWMKKGPHSKPDKLREGLHGRLYKLRDQK